MTDVSQAVEVRAGSTGRDGAIRTDQEVAVDIVVVVDASRSIFGAAESAHSAEPIGFRLGISSGLLASKLTGLNLDTVTVEPRDDGLVCCAGTQCRESSDLNKWLTHLLAFLFGTIEVFPRKQQLKAGRWP